MTDVEQIPNMSIANATKKTDSSSSNSARIAWFKRVRKLARIFDTTDYSTERLLGEQAGLRSHMREAGCVHLDRFGVCLVIVESLKGAKICGAAVSNCPRNH